MADKTGIEWTDATWNPTTGCDRASPGCDNCYAMTLAPRLKAMGSAHYQTDGDPRTSGPGFGVAVHPDSLDLPLQWKKSRRIFVNSMSDLFHKEVPDEFIADVWHVMAEAPQHTFQILTKRPARMRSWVTKWCSHPKWATPLPNVWLGVSVENQKWADTRIPALIDTPAAVRFLSCEPLLGPVDITPYLGFGYREYAVDWVIAGGESGHGARPMLPDWVRSLRNQCEAANDTPFMFKQWGAWVGASIADAAAVRVTTDGSVVGKPLDGQSIGGVAMKRVGKAAAGRLLDGRTHDEFPIQSPAGEHVPGHVAPASVSHRAGSPGSEREVGAVSPVGPAVDPP